MTRSIHCILALTALLLVPPAAPGQADPSTPAANRDPLTTYDPDLYLFAHDHWIARQSGLRRIANRAKPLETPVIWPEQDPRTENDCAWGNVIREPGGKLRMWYCTLMMGHNAGGPHEMARAGVWGTGDNYAFRPRSTADVRPVETMLGKYAESDDGVHWTKPQLGQIEFRGSRSNNIILNGELAAQQTDGTLTNFDGYTVVRDDAEPNPDRRYKMVAHWESVHCWDNHEVSGSLGRPADRMQRYWAARGEYITYSPDGLRWQEPLERLDTLPSGGGDRLLIVRDHRHQRWMAYVRASGYACPSFAYTDDFVHWTPPEKAEKMTAQGVQAPAVECMIPFNYGNQDLGFPCGMDKPKGLFTVMLAARSDGEAWEWVDNREPWIPAGPPGSYFASGAVPLHNEPFMVGDELLIFFNAFSRDPANPCPYGARTIGVAKLRRDGFAGLTAADPDASGTLSTRPIPVTGATLLLNVEQRGSGSVRAALLDEHGAPIPGFDFGDSSPITEDAVRARVTWKNNPDLSALKGRSARVALQLHGGAVLYALTLGTPQ